MNHCSKCGGAIYGSRLECWMCEESMPVGCLFVPLAVVGLLLFLCSHPP